MINKNFYRKTNDKKILHKVGKQWKVVSVALLMAIGGGAAVAATNNASANADATNYNTGVTAATSDEAQSLEAMGNYANPYANAPKSSSVAPSASAKAPSFENINYAPSARVAGNNASAASYKNNENFDKANMSYYGPIVKSYVNSINARYPEARSLATDYQTASDKAGNDQSLSGSYEATAKNSETANVIASKAAHDGVTASYYTDSVAYAVLGQNGYMNAVSNDASLATQESAVASGASLVSAIDADPVLSAEYHDKWELAAASASADVAYSAADSSVAADIVANSKANANDLVSAKSNYNNLSLKARIANINSNVDAQHVNSMASAAGFSFTSSVVSSAVSVMADAFGANLNDQLYGSSVGNITWTNPSYSANGSEVSSTADSVVFSATGQDKNKAQKALSINTVSSADDLLSSMNSNAGYASGHGDKNAYLSASNAYALYQVVSDTAAQSMFASQAPSLTSEISKDSLAVNSYTSAVSSAQSASTSASIEASASVSAENAASYLAGSGHDNTVSLAGIFGSFGNATSASVSGQPSVVTATSPKAGFKSLNSETHNNAIEVDATLKNGTTPSATSVKAVSATSGQSFTSNNGSYKAIVMVPAGTTDFDSAGNDLTTSANGEKLNASANTTYSLSGNPSLSWVHDADGNATKQVTTDESNDRYATVTAHVDNSTHNLDVDSVNVSSTGTPSDFTHVSGQEYQAVVALKDVHGYDQSTTNYLKASDNSNVKSNTVITGGNPVVTTNTNNTATSNNAKLNGTTNNNAVEFVVNSNGNIVSSSAINSNSKAFAKQDNGSYVGVSAETDPYFSVSANTLSYVAGNNGYANTGLFDANTSDANNYAAAKSAFAGSLNSSDSSAISKITSTASAAGSTYNSVSSASASYAKSADQDVTIASQFANYYGSLASSDATKAASAKNSLNSYYAAKAENQSAFANASTMFNSASAAEPNDADLAHAFGINVLNHSPKYIVLSHNAMLHSDPNYTKSNSVEAVKAGATFTVEGVGFDKVGNIRYEVAAKNGKPAFVTANDYYTENAYLEPGETFDVTLSHDAMEHTDLDYGKGKVAKKATAGTTFKNVTAVRADTNYEGITRLQLADGNYITANKYYLTNVQEVANNSNNTSNVQYGKVTF